MIIPDNLTPEKLKIVQRWYSNRFKWYGDEWLTMHDIFDKFTLVEIMQFEHNMQTNLLPPKERVYLTGEKLALMSQAAYINAINRIANGDKTGKYRDMLIKRGKLISLSDLEKQKDDMTNQMFR